VWDPADPRGLTHPAPDSIRDTFGP
jgi:hypothetical protein